MRMPEEPAAQGTRGEAVSGKAIDSSEQAQVKGKPDVGQIHRELREQILAGRIPAGTLLSQVELAMSFGVSRTPLREALRMLQEEGLIQAESNRRARVATFHLDDLEAISGQRILLSSLATFITVPHLDSGDYAAMANSCQAMAAATDADDIAGWRAADAAFHAVHYSRAPQRLHHEVIRLAERNDLYRSVWLRDAPHRDAQTVVEHERIILACQQHNVLDAVHGIARHQARIAITVLTHAVPEREPAIIRAALQLVLGLGLAG
jgi:DNA-binding GntR family transcriptional regulator